METVGVARLMLEKERIKSSESILNIFWFINYYIVILFKLLVCGIAAAVLQGIVLGLHSLFNEQRIEIVSCLVERVGVDCEGVGFWLVAN